MICDAMTMTSGIQAILSWWCLARVVARVGALVWLTPVSVYARILCEVSGVGLWDYRPWRARFCAGDLKVIHREVSVI
jgi:hypothetical protein